MAASCARTAGSSIDSESKALKKVPEVAEPGGAPVDEVVEEAVPGGRGRLDAMEWVDPGRSEPESE